MALFSIKTAVYSGLDSLEYLKCLVRKKIWIICDPFLRSSAALSMLQQHIPQCSQFSLFTEILPDPPIATIAKGVQQLCLVKPDIVIGFGGGSAIDAAKAIIYFGRSQGITVERFIAIPTTSGTGSEVTHASVISDPQKKVKYPLFDVSLYPDVALLVPQFVMSVPPATTAYTGMDVLTHALESWVATGSNDFTDALAAKAFRLVMAYLPTVWRNGEDLVAREKMHNAATMAGMAFSQAGLGLNHAIAHQLGGQFHIPHGLANALLLPHVVRFNAQEPAVCQKYAMLSRECGLAAADTGNEEALNLLITALQQMNAYLHIPTTLSSLNINMTEVLAALDGIVSSALIDKTFFTNPCIATEKNIAILIKKII